MDKYRIKQIIAPLFILRYRVRHYDKWLYIGKGCKLENQRSIYFGEGVQIAPYTLVAAWGAGRIEFGKGASIGMFSRVAANNRVSIGDYVLTGPNVFISDYNHEYRDVTRPICQQGDRFGKGDQVEIGAGSWIGANAVIVGNVKIGKNCVIGANSVVNRDVPDYCVAAGVPARIIKRYNSETGEWEKAE